MANILIAGCGYVGTALGLRLAAAGHIVWGIRRSAEGLPSGIHHLAADLTAPETLQDLPPALDVVFYTAAPNGSEEAAYRAIYVDGLRHVLEALVRQHQSPRRVLLTSSTAVYAQSAGEWVDETSPTEPQHFSWSPRAGRGEGAAGWAISGYGAAPGWHLWPGAHQLDRARPSRSGHVPRGPPALH